MTTGKRANQFMAKASQSRPALPRKGPKSARPQGSQMSAGIKATIRKNLKGPYC